MLKFMPSGTKLRDSRIYVLRCLDPIFNRSGKQWYES